MRYVRGILFFVFCLLGNFVNAQTEDMCRDTAEDLYRVLFILDASYSMDRKWKGASLWDISKKMIEDFSLYIQKNYNAEMGLRVYGFQHEVAENDCYDSELVVPIHKNSALQIIKKLKAIHFKGTTPLTYSLEKAAEDLGCNSHKNLIILITDGYETCNRNPCDVVAKLLDYRILMKPIVLGLNVELKDIEEMKCIGDFYNVRSKEEFKRDLYRAFDNATKVKTLSVFFKNKSKDTSETEIPFTIFDKKGKFIGSYMHHNSAHGAPDTFYIGDFDTIAVDVHTLPKIQKFNIPLKNHVVNRVEIPAPLSNLNFKFDESKYPTDPLLPLKVQVVVSDSNGVLFKDFAPFDTKFLQGNYQIDILTTPVQSAQISLKETAQTIVIQPVGVLNLYKSYELIGDIYQLNKRAWTKVATLNVHRSTEAFSMPAGKYKVVYRSQKAITLYGTFEREFEVLPYKKTSVNL